jgi:hypothetical protein
MVSFYEWEIGVRGCDYVEVCESKEQKGMRHVEERD